MDVVVHYRRVMHVCCIMDIVGYDSGVMNDGSVMDIIVDDSGVMNQQGVMHNNRVIIDDSIGNRHEQSCQQRVPIYCQSARIQRVAVAPQSK